MEWFKIPLQIKGSVAPRICSKILIFILIGGIISLLYAYDFPVSLHLFDHVLTNIIFNFVLGMILMISL